MEYLMGYQIALTIVMLICFAAGVAVGYYFAQKYFIENNVSIIEQSLEMARAELEVEIKEKYDKIYSNAYKAVMENFTNSAYKAIQDFEKEEREEK